MSDDRTRRGVFAVCVVALVALVCLLLGHRWLQGYLDDQRAKHPPKAPEAVAAGVAGSVSFADGSPAASARIAIRWTDSAGRPGATPTVTDAEGRFRQARLPVNATVTDVGASVGPLAANAAAGALPRPDARSAPLSIVLPAEFRLAGIVRRTGDRAGVADASLEIGGARATSGADGEFAIEHVGAAALRDARPVVRVAAAGYAPLDWPLPRDALPETYGDVTILLEPSK
jgi:hypothetical protein